MLGTDIEFGKKWAVKDIPRIGIVNDDREADDLDFIYAVGLQDRIRDLEGC